MGFLQSRIRVGSIHTNPKRERALLRQQRYSRREMPSCLRAESPRGEPSLALRVGMDRPDAYARLTTRHALALALLLPRFRAARGFRVEAVTHRHGVGIPR